MYTFLKNIIVSFGKKRRDNILNGVGEKEKNFKNVKNEINEINSSQRIRYRFPKQEITDQLENVFVFDLETCNDQESAEASAAGLNDENRLQENRDRDLSPDEEVTEKKCHRF